MGFSTLNSAILVLYLLGMLAIGLAFAGRQDSGDDFFLGGRKMPWWVVAMSMYASLTSAVTFIGLPAMAYQSNIALIAVCVVSPLLAPVLILLFYPVYRRMGITTSYEYLGERFGKPALVASSALFSLARLGWLGLVINAPALAISAVTDIPTWAAILGMGLLATAYTSAGGLAAVLWTDVAQFLVLTGGAVWLFVDLCLLQPGGLEAVVETARATDHLNLNWSFSLTEMTVLGVMIGFFFQMMQDYGTDQVTVQRLLAARTNRGVVKAICFNALVDFFIIGMLLFIGLGLFAFYQANPDPATASLASDQLLPYFIIQVLPNGLSGLLVAAIFAAAMSSMDSGINSLSTVLIRDLYQPLTGHRETGRTEVRQARWTTVILGLLGTGAALYVYRRGGNLIEQFSEFMSLFNAPVLGLFLMGLLTRSATFKGWCVGAAAAVPTTFYLQSMTSLNWVFYFPASLFTTLAVGMLASLLLKAARRTS